jgi:glyoxylase-like metal-dependent hydrolase (beta-lactamase superfamily II)
MTHRTLLLAAAALLAAGPAPAQTPQGLVARAVQAMGGEAAVRRLRTLTTELNLFALGLGQSETPESPPRATLQFAGATLDFERGRSSRTVEARAITGAVTRTRLVVAGGIGLQEVEGRPSPMSAANVAGFERAMRTDPLRLLLTAQDNPAALTRLAARTWRGEPHDGARLALGPDTLALWFDRRTGLLTVVTTLADDPILGDRETATWYTRWQDAGGGVRYPRQLDVFVNGMLQQHGVLTSAVANAPAPDSLFAIPDSIAARAPRGGAAPPAVSVQLVELAPNVWRAEGGSHHSLVVEQPTQLVVVEAPQNNARAQAVLDTLRSRFPTKPVKLVVNTHYHWDHSGGMRPFIAAGIPVATHGRNATFVRRVATARKTARPDALSRRPRVPVLRLVEDSLVVGDGPGRVVLYALPNSHVEGMLAAYVPAARVLFVSDVLPGNPPPSPVGSAEVLAAARAWGVPIERVAGGHGAVLAWADVQRAGGSRD